MEGNKFIKKNNLKINSYCYLDSAARYVAFNQIPVNVFDEKWIYPKTDLSEDNKLNLIHARNALIYHFSKGNIKVEFSDFYEKKVTTNPLTLEQEIVEDKKCNLDCDAIIPNDKWNHLEVNWDNNSAENIHYLDSSREVELYEFLHLNTSELFKIYPLQKKEKPIKTGRPTKYDWESFYIAITLTANTIDGVPEKQADLEAEMMQWCIDNDWQDIPASSMIRKKIAPIYQALRKDKKS